ncbi:hypothetical protein D3870_13820 [Noviherbaspirillum cavernae]|uniref:Uncharacterized protein n=1 Tax=Noviherbaspirillum cavernae TaxID=2320862 RepID=A0A418X386_9BURK|nr:hypothetical protein [Noviherbaspirillum cavernae]RJG06932.1 hypothetical protein D3870_13820 [Noviherbaspirillum cavernae]
MSRGEQVDAHFVMSANDMTQRAASHPLAIEAGLTQLLEQYEKEKTLHGRRVVVSNDCRPEREVLPRTGPLAVKVPKVRHRPGNDRDQGQARSFEESVLITA